MCNKSSRSCILFFLPLIPIENHYCNCPKDRFFFCHCFNHHHISLTVGNKYYDITLKEKVIFFLFFVIYPFENKYFFSNKTWCIVSIYYVQGSVPSALYVLSNLFFMTTLRGKYYYYPHFIDEKMGGALSN